MECHEEEPPSRFGSAQPSVNDEVTAAQGQ